MLNEILEEFDRKNLGCCQGTACDGDHDEDIKGFIRKSITKSVEATRLEERQLGNFGDDIRLGFNQAVGQQSQKIAEVLDLNK